MLHQMRHEMQQEGGFTLIELLVVILIIGILAAIAIPSFLNQRYKGQDACAKGMTKQMQTAAKTYQTDNNTYATMTLPLLTLIESSVTGTTTTGNCAPLNIGATSAGSAAGCTGTPSATGYCVGAVSTSTNVFTISESGGAVSRACFIPASSNAGGCKGSVGSAGTW